VNVILDTDIGLSFNRAGMLSSDGRCMAFDAGANGYVRSDGCGVVILKRLSQAIQDGDPIQAIIRASAVNQDGFSNGLTAPNPDAQKMLIQEALSRSRLSSDAVNYVETHGTGTPLGDAVEIQAIAAGYGKGRAADRPLILGSVKTNIGHCEAAAGVAGLIKVILSLQNEIIPGHLHFQKPGPHIKLEDIPAIIPGVKLPWPRNTAGPVRRGAISSYGFSGTNAHIIVEEAPDTPRQSHTETDLKPYLLTLSTKTPTAMPSLIRRYAAFLKAEPVTDTASLCHTTHIGRSHFPHRVAFVGKSASDFARQLHASETKNIHMDKQDKQDKRKKRIEGGICELAFLFTGPGSEYSGMGRGLYASEPSFRKNMDTCEQILDSIGSPGLMKRLFSNPGQPWRFPVPDAAGLFCIQYALAMLWRTWGISPVVVMGHSLGEYAAACVAGVFSLEDAIKLTAAQDRILAKLSPAGVMVSVLAGPDAVLPLLQKENRRVVIAALNSSRNTLIAGPNVSVDRVCAALNRQGIETIQISTACAYHSPLMEPAIAEWENAVQSIAYARPQIPLISTLTGQLEKESIAGYPYWSRHISSEVHFSDGVRVLNAMGSFAFLEIGPQPTLLSLAKQNLPELKTHWLPSLRHGMDERQQMLTSLGHLYELGADIHWENVDKGLSCRRISLPTYPFQRQSYWFDAYPKTPTSLLPAKDHFENLLYEMSWEKAGLLDTTIHPDGSWLILADHIGVGHELSLILMAAGRPCIVADARTFIPNSGIFEEDMAEWQQTLQQGIIDLIGSGKLTHVVYLWALDTPITAQLNPETLRQSQLVTVFAVPQILAALSQISQTSHARIYLITCGAVPVLTEMSAEVRGVVSDEKIFAPISPIDSRRSTLLSSVSQAPLWGMGRTAALEFPHLWGGLIDLDPLPEGQDAIHIWARTLLSTIFQSSEEDQIAIRQNRMYMVRLKIADCQTTGKPRSQFETLQPLMFCSDASYLITGGLGALGLQTASWMIRQGARHLVLTSRHEPSKPILDEIQVLKQSGANIYVGSADVADMVAMSRILSYIETNMPPLKGVVHAAGILIESLLPEMNIHEAWSVLAPKIQGAWVLHSLTRTYQLDFIIYYSSIAAIWGAKAQGCYAAANQFLDAMAHYNRATGQPALSVNWGPWRGEGMTGQDSRSWLKRRGLTAIKPEVSFSALSYLLQNDAVQMAVVDVNWPLFRRIYQSWGKHPLFDDLPKLCSGESCEGRIQDSPLHGQMRRQLLDAPESDRQTILVAYLQTQTSQIMGISLESGLLNPNQGFFSLGLDSIMAVELRQWIIQDMDIDLPMTALFDFPSMTKLAVYINEMLKVELSLTVDNLQSTANKSNLQSEIASQLDKELLELETLLRSH
jgi:acyl transferase domain-containing protein/acyl carrier protein